MNDSRFVSIVNPEMMDASNSFITFSVIYT